MRYATLVPLLLQLLSCDLPEATTVKAESDCDQPAASPQPSPGKSRPGAGNGGVFLADEDCPTGRVVSVSTSPSATEVKSGTVSTGVEESGGTSEETTVPTSNDSSSPVSPAPAPAPAPVPAPAPAPAAGSFAISSPSGRISSQTPSIVWDTSANAAKYSVKISQDAVCSASVETTETTATSYQVSSTLSEGDYYSCVSALNSDNAATTASNTGLAFTVDVTAPPALASVAGGFGATNGTIALTLTLPATVTDIDHVTIRRATGSTPPTDCSSGTLAATVTNGIAANAVLNATDTISSGSGLFSYRFCTVDAAGNLASAGTLTDVRVRTMAHRIFVTSGGFSPKLIATYNSHSFASGIEGADYRCQYAADHATSPLSGSWRAIVSDAYTDAKTHAVITGPVSNMNGELVASTAAEFWSGTLQHYAVYDENLTNFPFSTFTGSSGAGLRITDKHCSSWGMTSFYLVFESGYADPIGLGAASSHWLADAANNSCSNGNSMHLYCIDQSMPSALTLTASTGSSADGDVSIAVDFPADTTSYSRVYSPKSRWLSRRGM